jgi:hypothetical protein
MAAKKSSFDAESLRVLEDLFDVTWTIVQARHPFRDLERDPALQNDLRRRLFILAENAGLNDLDQIQRSALQTISQAMGYGGN